MTTPHVPSREASPLDSKRQLIRDLLAPADPADAMTAYYALEHPARRIQLTLHRTASGGVDGFLAVCQTGRDLFVPLVVMRTPGDGVGELVRRALRPGRRYLLVVPPALRGPLAASLAIDSGQVNAVHTLDPTAFRPVLNVMVQPGQAAYRHEIKVRDRVVAAAGINWRMSARADVYVYTASDCQGRGWGRAVGAACVRDLLSDGLLPLYTTAVENGASQALAEALGFRDSGAREFECQGSLRLECELGAR